MFSYKAPILLYHHVAEEGNPTMTVSPRAFGRQIEQLAEEKRVAPLEEWVEADGEDKRRAWRPAFGEARPSRQRNWRTRRPVMITFDDGFLDVYTQAFPLLQRRRLPATLFMVTDWVGREGFVTWNHLREMAKAGWTIGSHTKSHEYLPDLSPSRWEEEIRGSKETLEDNLQRPVTLLSYPVGGYTQEIIARVRGAGYRAACTTNRGSSFAFHPYRLTRIKMTESSHRLVVWAKTSGYYEYFKRGKRSH